ncbi:MAG TPA: autotransporter domain-containing protein [Novosphingobium sp.]|nr:autotransporter domain-containing protein [Novosphingobium sp.]
MQRQRAENARHVDDARLFFVNALAKYDHYWVDAVSNAVGYKESLEGNAIGAQVEAGFRFGSATFFAEPLASLAYVSTTLDDLEALGQVVDYEHMDGLRGKAGLRLGGTSTLGGGNVLTFYGSALAVKEFKGEDGITFVSGPQSFDLGNRRIGTYGQGTLGINITTPGGITGFIEGTADVSKDYSGAGGRAGIKIPF